MRAANGRVHPLASIHVCIVRGGSGCLQLGYLLSASLSQTKCTTECWEVVRSDYNYVVLYFQPPQPVFGDFIQMPPSDDEGGAIQVCRYM